MVLGKYSTFVAWSLAFAVSPLLTGCLVPQHVEEDEPVGASLSCDNLPENQRASFMAPLPAGAPAVVVADPGFSQSELSQIQNSVNEWNYGALQVAGRQLFELRVGAIPAGVRSANPRNCGETFGGRDTFFIVKETSEQHWASMGYDSSVAGVTLRCETSDHAVLQQQIVYIKGSNQPAQFQSIVTHELGHAAGLDHSCLMSNGTAEYASCMDGITMIPYTRRLCFHA